MTYKDELTRSMKWLAEQDNVVFLGQGLINGDRIYGTMSDVPASKCIEMPIAENLIMGSAIGLSLRGFFPIVIFQRMDFLTVACDVIVNHLALMPKMSGEQFKLPMIIRACVGSQSDKFDVGLQHKKDLTQMFEPHIKTFKLIFSNEIFPYYQALYKSDEPTLVVEYKDSYGQV